MINLFNHKLYTTTEVNAIVVNEVKEALSKTLPIGAGIRWSETETSPIPEGWIKAGTDISDTEVYDEKYDALRSLYGDILPAEDNTIFLAYYVEE